jgi:tRNA pseudouridine55 synthase
VKIVDGVLVVDKPEGWTSHDVVGRVRRLAKTKKVGHLGTLDPMATGVLPLVIGQATRLAQFFGRDRKIYEGEIQFGFATLTYDREGPPVSETVEPSFDREQLEQALNNFRGTFQQTPPPVSAKKSAGTPAYKLARQNIAVELRPVEVTVHALDVLAFDGARAKVRVECSSGTYLRSIAHDTGQLLGCGAFLSSLRRLRSGGFGIESAHTLDHLAALAEQDRFHDAMIPAADLLPEFPNEQVDSLSEGQIRQGRDFRVSPFRVHAGRYVKALTSDGELIAIGEARLPNLYHPILVFNNRE